MKNGFYVMKWLLFLLIFLFLLIACRSEIPPFEQSIPEATSRPTQEPTVEPAGVGPSPEPISEMIEIIEASERKPGTFDFEDGTTQGWRSREDKSVVRVVRDIAYSGTHSIFVTEPTEAFEGANVDVTSLLEPGNTYLIGGYIRMAEGEPLSRVIPTMQRTSVARDPVYEWIAPNSVDEATDSQWIYLEGQYTLNSEASELLLYFESPDEEMVDFYIDDVTITRIPEETGVKISTLKIAIRVAIHVEVLL